MIEFQLKQSLCVTIQMKATEQYFPVVLFIMPYKVLLAFESVDEILWRDSSKISSAALLLGPFIFQYFYKLKFRFKKWTLAIFSRGKGLT